MSETFRALVLDEAASGVTASIKSLTTADLPPREVTIAVEYSDLNYKDGMIMRGIGRLVRHYPHIPGIDFAGTVEASRHPDYRPGDWVILTGWRVGEVHWGGYAQKARVKGEWLVPMPDGLTAARAMAIGTAGITAMLAVEALELHGLRPDAGEVLVTGAAGGLGSVAVALLAGLDYRVAAATGRADARPYLEELGANTCLSREDVTAYAGGPLARAKWAGCIDTVGGATLPVVLPQLGYGACVAACGMAGGVEFQCNVLPFLLRGVNILGIESAQQPLAHRRRTWERLVRDLPFDKLDLMTQVIALDRLPAAAEQIIAGAVRGRLVVDVNA